VYLRRTKNVKNMSNWILVVINFSGDQLCHVIDSLVLRGLEISLFLTSDAALNQTINN